MACEITILCLTRHGHGTAHVCLESIFNNTKIPVRILYADIGSPPGVQRYLSEQARREGFRHLRFDHFISRQAARIKALELVDTPWLVALDNNMMCEPGWLEKLLEARDQTGATVVSPIIVTRGGRIHYSAGRVVQRRRRFIGPKLVHRPQEQKGAPVRAMLADCSPRRIDTDFAESHCCLVRTDDLRLPGILDERSASAHTMCCATHKLKTLHGGKIVVEPTAVTSIVPISFGYDLPWMCENYMSPELLASGYRVLKELLGVGPGTDACEAFGWHAKHFKYLLLTMLERDRFERNDLLMPDELPAILTGYDMPLHADADERIRTQILPRVERRYPELMKPLTQWLGHDLPVWAIEA